MKGIIIKGLRVRVSKGLFFIALLLAAVSAATASFSVHPSSALAEEVEIIDSAEDMIALSDLVNGGSLCDGKTYSLACDLDLSETAFASVGTASAPFGGVFLGNNHTVVLPLSVHTSGGLFAYRTKTSIVSAVTHVGGVNTEADFDSLSSVYLNNVSGRGFSFRLMSDLDFSESTFRPVGTSSFPFEGTFDGFGHSITVAHSGTDAAGIFAYTGSGCVLKNLTVRGSFSCTNANNVGGIVGYADRSDISACINLATITGAVNVGGIAGYSTSKISSCVNLGSVTAFQYFGGIAGRAENTQGYIKNCVNFGDLTAKSGGSTFGGIVGRCGVLLTDNYSSCAFLGSQKNFGSVVGTLSSQVSGADYCSYGVGSNAACGSSSAGAVPATLTVAAQSDFLFRTVRFTSSSDLVYGDSETGYQYLPYPSFLGGSSYGTLRTAYFKKLIFSDGDGSEEDPFVVSDADGWKLFVYNASSFTYKDKFVSLSADITVPSVSSVGSENCPFSGTFLGNNHTVGYSQTGTDCVGLFGCLRGATVQELTVDSDGLGGSVDASGQKAGVLVGSILADGTNKTVLSDITVTANCRIFGTVSVGGLVGYTETSSKVKLLDVACRAAVNGSSYVGGVIGRAQGDLCLSSVTNYGTVQSTAQGECVGGLIGCASADVGLLYNIASGAEGNPSLLANYGTVSAAQCTAVGGLFGKAPALGLTQSANVSSVLGRYRVGGLVGEATGNLTFTDCASVSAVTAVNYLAGFVGYAPFTVTANHGYSVTSFVKDSSVSVKDSYQCFVVSCPVMTAWKETDVTGCYELDKSTNSYSLTGDVSTVAGKSYFKSTGTVACTDFFYNNDIYTANVNTNGAVGKETVPLSDGTLFASSDAWEDVDFVTADGAIQSGYYPVPNGLATSRFSVTYYNGGNGKSDTPFLIANEQQLRNLARLVETYASGSSPFRYSQTADIALTRSFPMILTFEGVYCGNGFSLSGLNVDSSSVAVGLFAQLDGTLNGLIVNGGVVRSRSSSSSSVLGGLVGINNGTVTECGAILSVLGENVTYVGGTIGENNGTVEKAFFVGSATGLSVGGIAGYNHNVVQDAFCSGSLTASRFLGGIVGMNDGYITLCSTNAYLHFGGTTASDALGGIVGKSQKTAGITSGKVLACVSNAHLIYSGTPLVGGMVGSFDTNGSLSGGYYNSDFVPASLPAYSGQTDSNSFRKRTDEIRELTPEGYVSLSSDYNTSYDAYLTCRAQAVDDWATTSATVDRYSRIASEITVWEYDSDSEYARGTEQNPYQIVDAYGLMNLAVLTELTDYTDCYFAVTDDLDMSELTDPMFSIGCFADGKVFNGHVDGRGHTLSNLDLDGYRSAAASGRTSTTPYFGLFGATGSEFTLSRLNLDESCSVTGYSYVGALVGRLAGSIEECSSRASVRALYPVTTAVTLENYMNYYVYNGGYIVAPSTSYSTYYGLNSNVGGLVGSLAASGCSITNSVCAGTLLGSSSVYGLIGIPLGGYTCDAENSWYLTSNSLYSTNNYGSVLTDYSSVLDGGSVTIKNDNDGKGYYFALSCSSSFRPYVYNVNDSPLARQTDDEYYLKASLPLAYSVHFAQAVTVTVNTDDVLRSTLNQTEGYYYIGQQVRLSLAWLTDGYYLTGIAVSAALAPVDVDFTLLNENDNLSAVFNMPGSGTGTSSVTVTVTKITDSVFKYAADRTAVYDGTEKSCAVDAVASGFSYSLSYFGSNDLAATPLDAGTYTVRGKLIDAANNLIVGKLNTDFTVTPKVLTVSDQSAFASYTEKIYDGSDSTDHTVGYEQIKTAFSDGAVIERDRNAFVLSFRVTWSAADVGTNLSYTVDSFATSGTGGQNYTVSSASVWNGTDGKITVRHITVTVDEATVTDGKNIYTLVYTGYQPTDPAGVYSAPVSWSYTKLNADFSVDSDWNNATYDVGYYGMSPHTNDANYALDAATYYLHIVPFTVTEAEFTYSSMVYTGSDLQPNVTAYFYGTGPYASATYNAEYDFYRRDTSVTNTNFPSPNNTYFIRNGGGTGFVLADSYDSKARYYTLVDPVVQAGLYEVALSTSNQNYTVDADILSVTVERATVDAPLAFTAIKSGVIVNSGDTVHFSDEIVLDFTDDSKVGDADYDAVFEVEIETSISGKLVTEYKDGTWYLQPTAYGNDIKFYIRAIGATNYNDRRSEPFVLHVKPITLYVGVKHNSYTYGDEFSLELGYWLKEDETYTSVDPNTLSDLVSPSVNTGSKHIGNAGVYELFYSGGSSAGYKFDFSRYPTLTVLQRNVYVSVPMGLATTKTYGEADEEIAYKMYSNSACSIECTKLPNGEDIVLNGSLSRQYGEDVGSYYIYKGTLEDADLNKNYRVTFVGADEQNPDDEYGKFVILQRPLVLVIERSQEKYYGDPDQPFTLALPDSGEYALKNGDTLNSFLYPESGDPIVVIGRKAGETVGQYEYVPQVNYRVAGESNYDLQDVIALDKFTIRKAKPILTFSFNEKVYYGDNAEDLSTVGAKATASGRTVDGKFSWQKKTVSYIGTVDFVLNFEPTDTVDYAAGSVTVSTVTAKRPVTVLSEGDTLYVYNGSARNDITFSVENAVSGNNNYTLSPVVTGDNVHVSEEGFEVGFTFKSDWYVLDEDSVGYTVSCRILPATVTVACQTETVLYGDEFTPTITYSGWVKGESEKVLTSEAYIADIPTERGVYTLTPEGAEANDYAFLYEAGILYINTSFLENDGIRMEGSFSPDTQVELTHTKSSTNAFEDISDVIDKYLGATTFRPIDTKMVAYYYVAYSGNIDEGDYTYTVSLGYTPKEGSVLYLLNYEGNVTEIDDYTFDREDRTLTFNAGKLIGIAVYEEKELKETVLDYLPLAGVALGALTIIAAIAIVAYILKSKGKRDVYVARRGEYKEYISEKRTLR